MPSSRNIIFAATRFGYIVQVLDAGDIAYEYSAGNCSQESQTFIEPGSLNAVSRRQLNIWAKQTAGEIAKAQGIPPGRVASILTWKQPCKNFWPAVMTESRSSQIKVIGRYGSR